MNVFKDLSLIKCCAEKLCINMSISALHESYERVGSTTISHITVYAEVVQEAKCYEAFMNRLHENTTRPMCDSFMISRERIHFQQRCFHSLRNMLKDQTMFKICKHPMLPGDA